MSSQGGNQLQAQPGLTFRRPTPPLSMVTTTTTTMSSNALVASQLHGYKAPSKSTPKPVGLGFALPGLPDPFDSRPTSQQEFPQNDTSAYTSPPSTPRMTSPLAGNQSKVTTTKAKRRPTAIRTDLIPPKTPEQQIRRTPITPGAPCKANPFGLTYSSRFDLRQRGSPVFGHGSALGCMTPTASLSPVQQNGSHSIHTGFTPILVAEEQFAYAQFGQRHVPGRAVPIRETENKTKTVVESKQDVQDVSGLLPLQTFFDIRNSADIKKFISKVKRYDFGTGLEIEIHIKAMLVPRMLSTLEGLFSRGGALPYTLGELIDLTTPRGKARSSIKIRGKLNQFTLFPNLPLELQYAIWGFCLTASGPRTIELKVEKRTVNGEFTDVTIPVGYTVPSIYHTCSVSRHIAVRDLPAGYMNEHQRHLSLGIYFNHHLDTLRLQLPSAQTIAKLMTPAIEFSRDLCKHAEVVFAIQHTDHFYRSMADLILRAPHCAWPAIRSWSFPSVIPSTAAVPLQTIPMNTAIASSPTPPTFIYPSTPHPTTIHQLNDAAHARTAVTISNPIITLTVHYTPNLEDAERPCIRKALGKLIRAKIQQAQEEAKSAGAVLEVGLLAKYVAKSEKADLVDPCEDGN